MKPYFAKYLPIPGEIRAGDLYEDMLPYAPELTYVKCRSEEEATSLNRSGHNLVQLFICSKDIQIGDQNVYSGIIGVHEDDPGPEIIREINSEFQLGFIKAIAEAAQVIPFKVIGPMSTEAGWVKEGDEFDEEQWRRTDLIDAPTIYQILGPCNHWH